MGSYHSAYGINSQDFGFELENFYCVLDGCSSGKHTEIGVKLFAKSLFEQLQSKKDFLNNDYQIQKLIINNFFYTMKKIIPSYPSILFDNYDFFLKDMENYLTFTILLVIETDKSWIVFYCGDGYIITENIDNNLQFIPLDYSDTPIYLAYSFIDREYLSIPDFDLLGIKVQRFSKNDYIRIGVASDGLRFVVGNDYEREFKNLLSHNKEWKLRRYINALNNRFLQNEGFFKDDITIAIKSI